MDKIFKTLSKLKDGLGTVQAGDNPATIPAASRPEGIRFLVKEDYLYGGRANIWARPLAVFKVIATLLHSESESLENTSEPIRRAQSMQFNAIERGSNRV